MNSEYTVLPQFYDALNSGVDYKSYVDYILKFVPESSKILDLGCGTGDITHLLSERGVEVTGLDFSSEMLTLARYKADKKRLSVFYTCQNMTSFSTGKCYDAVVSTFDSLNYLLTKADLTRAFECVYRELKEGGVFLFDMNSEYKFENIYADNAYILEEEGIYCGWENYFDEKKKICHFYINVFAEEKGIYKRYFEEQRERMFTLPEILSIAKKTGFNVERVSSDFEGGEILKNTERYYFVLRK